MKAIDFAATHKAAQGTADVAHRETETLAGSMIDILPRDVLLGRIYPHLHPRDLAAASQVCTAMRLQVPDGQKASNPWTIVTRASIPRQNLPAIDQPFSELKEAYSREMQVQRNLLDASPTSGFDIRSGYEFASTGRYAASDSGRSLAVPSSHGRLRLLDAERRTFHSSDVLTEEFNPMIATQWYDQDQSIAVAFKNGDLFRLHVESKSWESFAKLGQDGWHGTWSYASFSPDLKYLMRYSGGFYCGSPLQLIALDTKLTEARLLHSLYGDEVITALKWNPLGGCFAAIFGQTKAQVRRVIDAASGTIVHEAEHNGKSTAMGWSTDGNTLATIAQDERVLRTFSLSSRVETRLTLTDDHFRDPEESCRYATFSNEKIEFEPSGHRMALLVNFQGVAVHDLEKGTHWMARVKEANCFSWSPSGRWLAITTVTSKIRILDADNPNNVIVLTPKRLIGGPAVTWTGSGHHLVTGSGDCRNLHVISFAPRPAEFALDNGDATLQPTDDDDDDDWL